MAWFDRHAGGDPSDFAARLDAAVAASGVLDALDRGAGAVGLRRYVVRAEVREHRVRVVGLDAPRLPAGGGPPAAGAFEAQVSSLEAALARLLATMPSPSSFGAVAIGFIRDAVGPSDVTFRFDEDAAGCTAAILRLPQGPSAPTEDPAYVEVLSQWTARIDEVRANWRVARGTWMFESSRLDDGERSAVALALGTWHPGQARWSWLLESPAGSEAPFVEPDLGVDLAGAMELACFAAARLGCVGVFQGSLETGQQFFAGLKS